MKTIILALVAVVGLAFSAKAVDKDQLDARIKSLTAQFTAMQQNEATRVPADVLSKAYGIILLDRTKGAFLFGYHSGNGIALVKDSSGNWSPASFVSSTGASLGVQIGGTKDFFVILMMSPNATEALRESVIDLGANTSATGGTAHGGMEGSLPSRNTMVYGAHNGVFAGAAIQGGSISTDDDSNSIYYGQTVSASGILFDNKVTRTPAEDQLVAAINQYSK